MNRFDRLYKTIFESVKPRPSKRNLNRIFKEDVNDQNTISITPEQRAIIEKVVAKLCAESQDYKNTVEFAELDTDFFIALLDGCYEDWLRDEGFDDEQPDMFDEKPGFEEYAYDTIRYYLQDYDADNENTAGDIWDNLSDLEYKLYWIDMVAELKPQIEAFKEACKKLVAEEGDDTFYLDQALSDTDWWDKNGLKYSPELGQEIKKYNRFFDWTYHHCFAGDDYCGWQIPDGLLERLGLEDWYHDEDKDTPDLPLESKKVDTSKKVIKESKLVSKRHIIKEEYSICDGMRKYFDKYNREYFDNLDNNDELDRVNEEKSNAYWGAISDVLKQNDPEKVKAFLNNIEELSDVEWEIINQRSGLNVTPEQLDIFEDFSAFNEMAEQYVNPYWGDGWMEEDVCEAMEKAGYGEYIDKITEIEESKKVDKSKKVIKESAKCRVIKENEDKEELTEVVYSLYMDIAEELIGKPLNTNDPSVDDAVWNDVESFVEDAQKVLKEKGMSDPYDEETYSFLSDWLKAKMEKAYKENPPVLEAVKRSIAKRRIIKESAKRPVKRQVKKIRKAK